MEKKIFNKKTLFIIFGVLLLGILTIIGTYAYFGWSSSEEDKDATVAVSSVNGLGQCSKATDNQKLLWPVSSRDKGRIVNIMAKQTLSEYAYITWTLTIDSINTPETETTGLKHQTFKYELVNTTTGISYGSGNFEGKEVGDTITFSNSTENLAYDTNYTFTLYLWIDGTIGNNPMDMTEQTYQFSLVCDITGEPANKVQERVPENAAAYITNLYTSADKETATVNSITYNLAPSVGLMNDRHASMSTDINGGDIRYYGANPNNYVWLGDTYTSTYTFNSKGTSITRNAGDKKLWRVIGVFDGRLKLISNDPISGDTGLSWDTSENTTGGNSGYGINQWGESTYSDTGNSYEGADLMRLLNSGYEDTAVNNSLYWTKGTGTVYTVNNNATTADVSFANTGLSNAEKNMIDNAMWYLGTNNGNTLYVNTQYLAERQSSTLGKICTSGKYCNDKVVRTSTWNGKVGLMYPSDYGYATDLTTCSQTLYNYNISANSYACRAQNWLYDSSRFQGTMSPRAGSVTAFDVFYVLDGGNLGDGRASYGGAVRPAVYLKSDVVIMDGNGSEGNPFVLNLNN